MNKLNRVADKENQRVQDLEKSVQREGSSLTDGLNKMKQTEMAADASVSEASQDVLSDVGAAEEQSREADSRASANLNDAMTQAQGAAEAAQNELQANQGKNEQNSELSNK